MNKRFLAIVLSVISSLAYAQDRQYINYFSAGGDVCLPVTVKHSRGEFTFFENNYRIDGPIDYVEAWDCEGRKILDTTPKSNSGYSSDTSVPKVYTYVFTTLYPQSSTSLSESTGYESSGGYDSSYSTSSGWDNLSNAIKEGMKYDDPAYPNFTFQTGVSRVHGEFIRGKACLGGMTGYVLYGGIGRDWLFNPKNEKYIGTDAKKLGWHVGLGWYGGDLTGESATGEFALMMDYADTPLVEGGSLNLWLEGTWYFGAEGHFGAFGGLGYSWGNLDDEDHPKFNFIFEIGIAYRIF